MPTTMRAKMTVRSVETHTAGEVVTDERLNFSAVTSKPFNAEGENEDNDYARWTPSADLGMTVTNPNLFGKFKAGDTFYVDFTPVVE